MRKKKIVFLSFLFAVLGILGSLSLHLNSYRAIGITIDNYSNNGFDVNVKCFIPNRVVVKEFGDMTYSEELELSLTDIVLISKRIEKVPGVVSVELENKATFKVKKDETVSWHGLEWRILEEIRSAMGYRKLVTSAVVGPRG